MSRGDIWTVSGGYGYAGKPRPAVIIQDDTLHFLDSVTVCLFTTVPHDVPLVRLPVDPNERNGLNLPCQLMVEKVTTVPRTKLGVRIGRLDDEDMARLNRALLVVLGLAGTSPRQRSR